MALVLGVSAPTIAAPKAASVKLVMVEVDDHEMAFSNQLQPTTIEPGGLFVPPDVAKEWLELGLLPGDIIRFANGSPTTDHFYVADGVTVLDIVRNGKPAIIHIMAHGKSTAQVDLSADSFKDLIDATTRGPIATPLLVDNKPSGVRVIDMLVPLYIQLYAGDIVRSIDGKPVHTDAELVAALRSLRIGTTNILVERADRPVSIEIRRAAPIDFAKIRSVGHNHYELPRSLVKALSEEPSLMTQQIQLVPVARNGTIHGHKIFGIESGSVAAAAGLQNDDVVLDINDKSLDSTEQAYSANYELSSEDVLKIHLERKGKPLELVYTVID
jgi:S1-C subfamily serine protease